MDDRFAYLLNGLWARHYDLGRVVRFRQVQRGRQAASYEILTAQQKEYTLYLFPPQFDEARLAWTAQTLNALDANRFSVCPMVKAKDGTWAVGGPQGTHMVVGLNTDGRALDAPLWSTHDVSQLGLRLGWLHRLLEEQVAADAPEPPLQKQLAAALHPPADEPPLRMPRLNPAHTAALAAAVRSRAAPRGWAHGEITPAALLLDADHQIRTIVDWGLLHPGNPLEDLIDAFLHWCLAPDGLVNADAGRALLESYRSLRALPPRADTSPWVAAVETWLARRIITAAHDTRPLPRGFSHLLATPAALAESIALCEAK